MKSKLLLPFATAIAGTYAQRVAIEGWFGGNCDGRPFVTANVGTGCVNVEQFPVTNIKATLVNGCADGKIPVVKVSAGDCDTFAVVGTLKADGACSAVDYAPQAYSVSCE